MPMVSAGFIAGWFGEALLGVRLLLHGRGARRELIMTVKHGAGRSVQGLSGVRMFALGGIFLSYVAYFVAT